MEVKKTPKADLENKKNIFFEIGLMMALSAVFFAFEWKSSTRETSDFITVSSDLEDEIMVPITQTARLQPPPPPPRIRPLNDLITIIDDEEEPADVEITDVPIQQTGTGTSVTINDINGYDSDINGEEESEVPFVVVENMPYFPNVQQWIAKHINYPTIAADMGIQGKVIVQFIIERNGSISDVKIVRGVDNSLDKEAVRVIESMPAWKPGSQRGKPVRVAYTLPINFQLSNW